MSSTQWVIQIWTAAERSSLQIQIQKFLAYRWYLKPWGFSHSEGVEWEGDQGHISQEGNTLKMGKGREMAKWWERANRSRRRRKWAAGEGGREGFKEIVVKGLWCKLEIKAGRKQKFPLDFTGDVSGCCWSWQREFKWDGGEGSSTSVGCWGSGGWTGGEYLRARR